MLWKRKSSKIKGLKSMCVNSFWIYHNFTQRPSLFYKFQISWLFRHWFKHLYSYKQKWWLHIVMKCARSVNTCWEQEKELIILSFVLIYTWSNSEAEVKNKNIKAKLMCKWVWHHTAREFFYVCGTPLYIFLFCRLLYAMIYVPTFFQEKNFKL